MDKKNIDFKHPSHLRVIQKLREKRLNNYIKFYKKLVYLIPPNSQKNIFTKFQRDLTSSQIESLLIPYFIKFNFDHLPKEKIKYPDRTNSARNKNYRDKQILKKRVRLSFYVDSDFYEKLNKIKSFKTSRDFYGCSTYEDIFKELLNTHFRSKFK